MVYSRWLCAWFGVSKMATCIPWPIQDGSLAFPKWPPRCLGVSKMAAHARTVGGGDGCLTGEGGCQLIQDGCPGALA